MSYPSRSETERLERWPHRIELEELRECFALSDRDREVVFGPRGAGNRLGLAVQLCALRFLGFVPVEIAGIPAAAMSAKLPALSPEEDEQLMTDAGFSDLGTFYAALSMRGWIAHA